MENIIGELINIEKTAAQFTKTIEEEQKKLPLNINRRIQEIDAEMQRSTEEKIKNLQKEVYMESQREIEEIKLRAQERTVMLEQDFQEKHVQWEDEIFWRIIGR